MPERNFGAAAAVENSAVVESSIVAAVENSTALATADLAENSAAAAFRRPSAAIRRWSSNPRRSFGKISYPVSLLGYISHNFYNSFFYRFRQEKSPLF